MPNTAELQLQIRRGAAAAWTSANPTLLVGELGYETDTGIFKVGDGSTAWTGLSYDWFFGQGIYVHPPVGDAVLDMWQSADPGVDRGRWRWTAGFESSVSELRLDLLSDDGLTAETAIKMTRNFSGATTVQDFTITTNNLRLEVQKTTVGLATGYAEIGAANAAERFELQGGGSGARIILEGGTASNASDMQFLAGGGIEWALWDESLGAYTLSTGIGAKTLALTPLQM
jgi:hypothetical protein